MAKKHKKTTGEKTNPTRAKKSSLTSADIERFKRMLLEKRLEIVGSVNEIRNETLKKPRLDASGDLSSMPIHMADIGTDNYEQELALGLMDSERKLLREIDDALQRMEDGGYGICEATGEQITKGRLKAKPWARYCFECARKLEEGVEPELE